MKDIVEQIDARVTIKTNIVEKVEIPVKAFITEPRIVPVKDIDFGKIQIGTQAFSDVTVSNPFNHTIAIEFYIGRNTLRQMHLAETKAYEYQKEFDKARLKAMKQNDSGIDGLISANPASEYAKRYRAIIDEFKSSNKLSALTKLPHMKLWCEREEFKELMQRKTKHPDMQDLGLAELEFEKLVQSHLREFNKLTKEEAMQGPDFKDTRRMHINFEGVLTDNPLHLCAMTIELFMTNPKS